MTKTVYRQCLLVKLGSGGETVQMSWLPEEYARPTRRLRLRGADGSWESGWVVRAVGRRRTDADLQGRERSRRGLALAVTK